MARSIIKLGSTGEDVKYLQQSLTKLSYNPGPIDGVFGPKTNVAVKSFQKTKGLVVDGIVGSNTWNAIEKVLQAVPTPPKPTPTWPLLKRGSTGAQVTYLQQSLTKLSYKPGAIDGVFGPATEAAVKLFQKAKGLVADGIVGNATWAAINDAIAKLSGLQFKINMFANIQGVGNVYLSGINDCIIGTAGQARRIEAVAIYIDGIGLKYNVFIQDVGDIIGKIEGQFEGTMGQAKRMEAITIIVSSIPKGYKLQYQVYIRTVGWQAFKESGQLAGTQGKSLQIEALRIRIIKA